MDPELIFSNPAIHFKKVVFPDPLSPKNEINCPFLLRMINPLL